MPNEVRNLPEGSMRWVQSSGTGGWLTASAPNSGLFGYVRAGMSFQQPRKYGAVYNRGTAGHFKFVQKETVKVTFSLGYGVTADYPPTGVTASGVSVPQIHLEFKATAPESPSLTGLYWEFLNCVPSNRVFKEGDAEDTYDFTFEALDFVGPTASGFLS